MYNNNIKVIIADDIFSNQLLVKSIIELAGYKCKAVANGKLLVEALLAEHFDIIFTDIEMPVMNGIETVIYIREKLDETYNKIPVIAMTAHNMAEIPEKIKNAGFNDLITKPYSVEKINQILKKYIENNISETEKNNKEKQ